MTSSGLIVGECSAALKACEVIVRASTKAETSVVISDVISLKDSTLFKQLLKQLSCLLSTFS